VATHYHTEGINAHLNERMQFWRTQLGQLQNYLGNMGSSPRDQEAAAVGRERLLERMEEFFSVWRATPVGQGAALLYSQTVPAAPEPPS